MQRISHVNKTVRSSYVPLIGIVISGLLALSIVIVAKQKQNFKEPQPVYVAEYDTVDVPVPAKMVAAGTPFQKIILEKIKYPKHQLPDMAILNSKELEGLETLVSLPAKTPLFRDNFTTSGSSLNPVIESIPAGMRAMTIKVDATSAVEGWAGSGSIVDVLLVDKAKTIVIAEHVKILSSERSVAPVEGQVAPNVPSTVTLLVTQEQCLKINTAIPRGKIAFALRSFNDQDDWQNPILTADNLMQRNVSTEEVSDVQGYLEVHDEKDQGKYVFVNGKWLKTPERPQGFFVGS